MRCRSRSLGAFASLPCSPNLGRRPRGNVRKLRERASELSQRSVQNALAAYTAFPNTANAASSQTHGDPRPREMSGNVPIKVVLIMERVFDAAIWRSLLILALPRQPQKRLPSVSTYAARGGGARRTPQFLQPVPLRAFSSAVERARSGFAHTPLRAQTQIGAAPPRADVKRAPGRRYRGAQKAAHSNPQNN